VKLCIVTHIPLGSLNRVPALIGWGKGGNVTSAGWQVTPCNPIWHVSSRSGAVLVAQTAIRFLTLPYNVHSKRNEGAKWIPMLDNRCWNEAGSETGHYKLEYLILTTRHEMRQRIECDLWISTVSSWWSIQWTLILSVAARLTRKQVTTFRQLSIYWHRVCTARITGQQKQSTNSTFNKYISFEWNAHTHVKRQSKVFPYSSPSVGPAADPDVQVVSPQVTNHPPGSKLPLLSDRPAVTSVAFTRWSQRYVHEHCANNISKHWANITIQNHKNSV